MPDTRSVRSRSLGHCAWCGQSLLRKSVEDDYGVRYHVICLARRRAILGPSVNVTRRPLASANRDRPANRDALFIIKVLESGMACLACLVSRAGLSEARIIDAVRL